MKQVHRTSIVIDNGDRSYKAMYVLITVLIFYRAVYGQTALRLNDTNVNNTPENNEENSNISSFSTSDSFVTQTTTTQSTLVERRCHRLKQVTYRVTQVYPAICYILTDKCSGWLRNKKCRKVPLALRPINSYGHLRTRKAKKEGETSGIPCTKTRYVLKTREEKEQICCAGYLPVNGTLFCERGCSPGFYGDQCQYACNCPANAEPDCDIDVGSCKCRPGWIGSNCSETCPQGKYGWRCRQDCLCRTNSVCHPVDGSCNCTEPGWKGKYCDEACPDGSYGYSCSGICTCNVNQKCDRQTGSCTCKAGLRGKDCDQKCHAGYFGEGCNKVCACSPEHTDICDHVTGNCTCKPGYTGKFCTEVCEAGTYGSDCKSLCSCGVHELCDHVSGQCRTKCICSRNGTSNCDPDKPCPCEELNIQPDSQHKRESNDETCNVESKSTTCEPDNTNRTCLCKPGWKGESCGKVCPKMRYGLNCQLTCSCAQNTSCNPVDGKCLGSSAENKLLSDKTISSLIIVGYVSLVVVPFVIVPIALQCHKERKRSHFRNSSTFSKKKKKRDDSSDSQAIGRAMHTRDATVSQIGRETSMSTFNTHLSNDSRDNMNFQSFKEKHKPSLTSSDSVYMNGRQAPYSNGQARNYANDDMQQRHIYRNSQQNEPQSSHSSNGIYDIPCNGRPVIDDSHIYWNADVDDEIYNLLQETCKTKIVDSSAYTNLATYNNEMYLLNNNRGFYDSLHAVNIGTDLSDNMYHHSQDLTGTYNTLQNSSPKNQILPDPPYDTVKSIRDKVLGKTEDA